MIKYRKFSGRKYLCVKTYIEFYIVWMFSAADCAEACSRGAFHSKEDVHSDFFSCSILYGMPSSICCMKSIHNQHNTTVKEVFILDSGMLVRRWRVRWMDSMRWVARPLLQRAVTQMGLAVRAILIVFSRARRSRSSWFALAQRRVPRLAESWPNGSVRCARTSSTASDTRSSFTCLRSTATNRPALPSREIWLTY